MKKSILLLTAMLCTQLIFAQWSGTSLNGTTHRNGNVGIGTDTPTSLLDINTPSVFQGKILKMGEIINTTTDDRLFNFAVSNLNGSNFVGSTVYDFNGKLRKNFQSNNSFTRLIMNDQNGQSFFAASTTINDAFLHLPKLNSKLVVGAFANFPASEGHKFFVRDGSAKIEGDIFTDARIGIGTDEFNDSTGSYVLSVDGRVRATAVRVYTGWADYVFNDDYNLPTLKEVENHINTYGHLKDIPSAKIVEEEGIDIGEMNKLLLQKVEELTLYIIELNKEVELLKNKK